MGALSKFEGGVETAFDRAAGAVFKGPIEPAQIAKRAEKQMLREKLVGAGKQHAPTLYTVLVNANDDRKLFGFYPTMGAEIETYLMGKGAERGLVFDGRPLVRFIVDDKLKSGRFDVIAEVVAAPIIATLRQEELEYYGIAPRQKQRRGKSAGFDEPDDDFGAPRDGFDVSAGVGASAGGFGSGAGAASVGAGGGAGAAASAAVGAASAAAAAPSPEIAGLRDELRRKHRDSGRLRDDIALADPAAAVANRAANPAAAAAAAPVDSGTLDSLHAGALVQGATTAPAMGNARLVNMSAGKTYALTRTEMTLGRDPSCEIAIGDANASRRHAQLAQDVVGTWKIRDLNSTNGILLNNRLVSQALLRDGDEITIGVTILQFREA